MKRRLSPLLMLSLLALAGCGDDGDGGDGGGDIDAGPLPTNQCVNANDTPIVEIVGMIDAGPGLTQTPGDYILDCLDDLEAPCYPLVFDETTTDQQMADCLADCVSGTPTEGLSDGCLICYSPAAACAAELCTVPCVTGNLCYECMEEMGCLSALRSCTGLAIP